jgi:hypothetical protein
MTHGFDDVAVQIVVVRGEMMLEKMLGSASATRTPSEPCNEWVDLRRTPELSSTEVHSSDAETNAWRGSHRVDDIE